MASRCGPRGRRPRRLCRRTGDHLESLEVIIADYRRDDAARAAEDAFWADEALDLEVSIAKPCRSHDVHGVKHSHQNLIPPRGLARAGERLRASAAELRGREDFEALHDLIKARIGSIRGVGPLQVYDFATRIGLRLGLHPQRVHLHAGTTQGARALGLDVRGRHWLRPEELPAPLRDLTAGEIEDILCIYKRELAELPR